MTILTSAHAYIRSDDDDKIRWDLTPATPQQGGLWTLIQSSTVQPNMYLGT